MLHARLRAAAGNLGGIPTDGLVAWYTMDNISGSIMIDETGTNDATIFGSPSQVSGVIGQALDLDGIDDWIESNSVTEPLSDFTVCLWLSIDDTDRTDYIFSLGYNNSNSLIIFTESGIGYRMVVFDGGSTDGAKNIAATIPPGNHHISLKRSGNTIYFRVNNSQTYSISGSLFDPAISEKIQIGWASPRNNANAYHNGIVDQFLLYNRFTSQDEDDLIYNEGA